MSRFRKSGRREVPSLNTASLPDLIFTLLFFFMIVSNIKEPKSKLHFEIPNATEIERLKKNNLVTFIFIGESDESINGKSQEEIQVNNQVLKLSEIKNYLLKEKERLPEEFRNQMLVVLKIDKNAKMKKVFDLKEILKETDISVVNYAAERNRKF